MTQHQGTLAELAGVQPDVEEVYLEDGLERAAQSYRRYLEETAESERTPEAMRRLADLQIEQAYGVINDEAGSCRHGGTGVRDAAQEHLDGRGHGGTRGAHGVRTRLRTTCRAATRSPRRSTHR